MLETLYIFVNIRNLYLALCNLIYVSHAQPTYIHEINARDKSDDAILYVYICIVYRLLRISY